MKALIYLILIIFVGILTRAIWIIQPLFSLVMLIVTVTIKLENAKVKKINTKHIGEEQK